MKKWTRHSSFRANIKVGLTALAVSLAAASFGNASTASPGASLGASSSIPGTEKGADGPYRNTWYYLVLEADHADEPRTQKILDMEDRVIAWVGAGFMKNLSIEGSGKLLDGRVINYFGKKEGKTRWHVTRHPYGRGVGDCALVPFHTVAVDPTRIPLGSLVWIKEFDGMVLPDGSVHNGLWRAEDVGSAIQKDRIDLFVGDGTAPGEFLESRGITTLRPLQVRLISGPPADSCVSATPAR